MTYYVLLRDMRIGGSEHISTALAKILKDNGREVRFICLGEGEGELLTHISSDFEVESLGRKRTLTSYSSLTRLMRSRRDACFFSSLEYVSLLALVVGRRLNIPVIVRLPNMPGNKLYKGFTAFKWKVIRGLNRLLLKRAQTIIAQTDSMREEAINLYKLPPEKVVTIYNPLDEEMIREKGEEGACPFDTEKVNFLTVANIAYSKGIDVLLEAFDIVSQSLPNAVLTIVGRDNSKYATDFLSHTRIPDNVVLAGFQANPYVYMRHCDVFVLPSRMEGFPNVLLEAMCFDKPVACTTCVSVIRQIVSPGVNGYYCDSDNPQQLAEIMLKSLQINHIRNHYELFDQQRLLSVFP